MNSYHWLRAFLILLATCALVLTMTQQAFAERGEHGHHQMPAYSDLDADGDNKVTAEEFYAFRASRMAARAAEGHKMKHAKDAPAFEDLDLDGDGSLSADEFAEHHAQCPMHRKRNTEESGQ
jgi:Ca2+-binding EF-hand superfamily protein